MRLHNIYTICSSVLLSFLNFSYISGDNSVIHKGNLEKCDRGIRFNKVKRLWTEKGTFIY